jgi:ABC-type glycerol-3-phosphate transport system permease component
LRAIRLELGGSNAFVVLDDADVELAAGCAMIASLEFQGQTCIRASRHIVQRAVADAYLEAVTRRAAALQVGDPFTPGAALGPLISTAQIERLHRTIVEPSLAMGAKLVTGGTYDGLFYRPTVLTDVTPEMPAFREEVFGPVIPVTVVDTEASTDTYVPSLDLCLVHNIRDLSDYQGGVFWRWMLNSFIYAGVGGLPASFVSPATGYALATYAFRGRTALFNTILAGVLLPQIVLAVPQYLLLSKIGLTDSLIGVLLTSDDKFPLTVGLYSLLRHGAAEASLYSLVITGTVLSVLSVIALFLSLQRFWRIDLVTGALK